MYIVFHPLCYDNGQKYLENSDSSETAKMLRMQINEFGQVPKQLFKGPHPQRYSNSIKELAPPTIEKRKESTHSVNPIPKKPEIKEEKKVKDSVEDVKENIKKEEKNQKEELEEKKEYQIEPILNISFSLKKTYNLLKNHHKRYIHIYNI